MKNLLVLILPTLLVTSVSAQDINIQQIMAERCAVEIVHFKVADIKTANKLCKCTTNVHAKHLKLGEFWEVNSYVKSGKDVKFLPQMKRIQLKLKACHKGLILKQPTLPPQPKK